MRSQERRQRLDSNKLDCAAQACLKQLREREKTVVRLGPRKELDQEVDVAVAASLTTCDGTEECEPLHTQCTDLRFRRNKPFNCLFSGKRGRQHTITSLARSCFRSQFHRQPASPWRGCPGSFERGCSNPGRITRHSDHVGPTPWLCGPGG